MMPKARTKIKKPAMCTIRAEEAKDEPSRVRLWVDSSRKNLRMMTLLNIDPIAVAIEPIANKMPPLDLYFR